MSMPAADTAAVMSAGRDVLEHADDSELAHWSRYDADAFGVLYARYRHQTYRLVRRRVLDPVEAEDVTAEVFLKAFQAIDGYRPTLAPFWAWLYRIAQNAAIDHLRSRRPVASLTAVMDTAAAVDVEAEVVGRTEMVRAWQAVSLLCATQQTALTLRLVHDLPIADIAEQMDRSAGAVKLLLNRGLKTVRVQLVDGQDDDGRGRPTEPRPAPGRRVSDVRPPRRTCGPDPSPTTPTTTDARRPAHPAHAVRSARG